MAKLYSLKMAKLYSLKITKKMAGEGMHPPTPSPLNPTLCVYVEVAIIKKIQIR